MGPGPARGVAGAPRGRWAPLASTPPGNPGEGAADGAFGWQLKSGFGADLALWTEAESFLDSEHGGAGL